MEGLMDERKAKGNDTEAEEDVFGLAVCSGEMWENGQDAYTNEGKEEEDNERGWKKVRQTEAQPHRLSTGCTYFTSNGLKTQKK